MLKKKELALQELDPGVFDASLQALHHKAPLYHIAGAHSWCQDYQKQTSVQCLGSSWGGEEL